MQAVVLTAGRGTRLRPVTEHVPKPMIPFWGRPFIEYVLDPLLGEVEESIIVTDPEGAVQAHLGEVYRGMPLRYVVQDEPRGTADAAAAARELVTGPFLLLLGDTCTPAPTIEALGRASGEAVLTLIAVPDPQNHGPVSVDAEGRVTALGGASTLVDAGNIRFEPSIFAHIAKLQPVRGELRILQAVRMMLQEEREVRAVQMPPPWLQFGDHEGVAGVCRVMHELRTTSPPGPLPASMQGRMTNPQAPASLLANASSVQLSACNCRITNSLVFGPGELHDCCIHDSLIYCAGHVRGRSATGEIAAWV